MRISKRHRFSFGNFSPWCILYNLQKTTVCISSLTNKGRKTLRPIFKYFNSWPEEPFLDARKQISRSLEKIWLDILLTFAGKTTEIVLRKFSISNVMHWKCIDHQPSSPKILSPKPPASSTCARVNIFLLSTYVWHTCIYRTIYTFYL